MYLNSDEVSCDRMTKKCKVTWILARYLYTLTYSINKWIDQTLNHNFNIRFEEIIIRRFFLLNNYSCSSFKYVFFFWLITKMISFRNTIKGETLYMDIMIVQNC